MMTHGRVFRDLLTKETKTTISVEVEYINETIPYIRRTDYESISPQLECIWLELKTFHMGSIMLCTAYRAPSLSGCSWIQSFEDMLEAVYIKHLKVIITGDYNFDLLNHESLEVKRWINLLSVTYNFTSLVNSPTRITRDSLSIVDHLFESHPHIVSDVTIPNIGLSDHYPVLFSLSKSNMGSSGRKTITYRCFKLFIQEDFLRDLLELPWTTLHIFDEPDDALECWYTYYRWFRVTSE